MNSKNARKMVLSLLLALALFLGGLPVTAFAEDGGITGEPPVASPGTTGQASVTFDIQLNEFDETWFFLTEGIPLTDADLLDGVTAVDENGDPVTVTVGDAGGLDLDNPQRPDGPPYPNIPYTITYAAVHPVSGAEFTQTRDLFITPGLGGISPTANGDTTWSGAAPNIGTWDGDNNTITVGSGATGTLTIPAAVTGLTINGNGNTIAGPNCDELR